jgi:uncharacterized protein
MEKITQSLAGRIVSFHLYPLSLDELYREAVVPDTVATNELLLKGFYYWRDKSSREIDLLVENGQEVLPIETKSARTYTSDFAKNLLWRMDLPGNEVREVMIIYDGNEDIGRGSSTPCVSRRRMRVLLQL